MRAGLGKWELTPPMGVELAGYGYYLGRRAESVRDPLYARALLLEEKSERALIISCDLLGLSKAVCADVFAHAEALGIPRERVLIVSIHTHTGPAIKYHEGCGFVNDAYVATVAPAICRAVDEAVKDLEEVTGIDHLCEPMEASQIYNRTIPGGPVDRFVRGFFFTRQTRPTIAAVSAACHGVFRGRVTAVSADFAGEICRRLAESGMEAMYLNGLCGDIDPVEKRDDLLMSFAAEVTEHLKTKKTALPLTLQGGSLPFELKLIPVTREDIHQAARPPFRRCSATAGKICPPPGWR